MKAGKATKQSMPAGKHSGIALGAVKISPEVEKSVRKILEGVRLEEEMYEVGSRLTVKKAARKYRDMCLQLLDHGFAQSQIEPAMRALPLGCTSIDVVMDWLMLNISPEDLPRKFTSSNAAASGPVQFLSKAPGPPDTATVNVEETSQKSCQIEAEQDVSGFVEANVVKKKKEEDSKYDAKSYIMQYLEERSSSEEESDGLSDYGAWSNPKDASKRKEEKKREKLPMEARQKLIAEELSKYKKMASDAKAAKDKAAQKEAGGKIGLLRREMVELGMTDEMVEALLQAQDDGGKAREDHLGEEETPGDSGDNNGTDMLDMEAFGMAFDILDDNDEDPGPSDAQINQRSDTSLPQAVSEEEKEEEDIGMGLFSEDVQWEEPKTEDKPKRSTTGVVPWGMKRVARNRKPKTLRKPEAQVPVQNLPRAILTRHCQQKGWGHPTFEKLPEAVEGLRYAVNVDVRSNTRKEAVLLGKRRFQVSSFQDGWATIQDAQNAASTVALVHLLPDENFQHSLTSPFRDLFIEIKQELEAAKSDDKISAEDEWLAFVDELAEEKCGRESMRRVNSGHELDHEKEENLIEAPAAPLMTRDRKLDENLLRQMEDFNSSTEGLKWWEHRNALPVAQIRKQLVTELRRTNAMVLCGDTGCGKTTQVPQYIFEDYVAQGEGSNCSILCTQPRRLAAVSVSERVADEMGQSPPGTKGSLLGYHVRLDPAISRSTRITFCTTGILLRKLTGDRLLKGVSHVVVDEVHERTMQGDFLLVVLKDLVSLRESMGYPLKVILMSATLEQSLFSEYFNCGVVTTEGRTFPVDHYFLEDVYSFTGYNLDPESPAAMKSYGRGDIKALHQKRAGSKEKASLLGSGWGDTTGEEQNSFEVLNPYYDPDEYKEWGMVVRRNLARVNEDRIDYEVLEQLICHIDGNFPPGCILVFLPGMGEINQLYGMLAPRKQFDANWLVRLHSSLTPEEQKKAFSIPAGGIRKVVISTNIAETSLTIPDVVYVVDSGKLKERRFDPGRGISMLVEDWVAKASAKQRKGRAGRVQSGHCFSLFTRSRYNSHMKSYQKPEIMRMPLEEIILQVHSLRLGNSMDVMEKLVQPPEALAVRKALENLMTIGAIKIVGEKREVLTPLGEHLAHLPVDVRIGKLLVWAACFGCLSPALTIAAALSGRSIFVTGPDQSQSNATRKKIAAPGTKTIASGEQSDLLVVVAAYEGWQHARAKGGWKASRQYAKEQNLHIPTMEAIKDLRLQFVRVLAEGKLIQDVRSSEYEAGSWVDSDRSTFNKHKRDPVVVKALLCAALYPNIAVMRDSHGGPARWMNARNEVEIHKSSVNHGLRAKDVQYPYMTFLEKVKTHTLVLRDCSVVSPLSLMLFGGGLKVKHESAVVSIDDWINIKAVGDVAVLMKKMRKALDDLISEKLKQPTRDFSDFDTELLSALVQLLRDEARSNVRV